MSFDEKIREIIAMYNRGNIYDAMKVTKRLIIENGSENPKLNHLLAVGYFANKEYYRAAYWLNKSNLGDEKVKDMLMKCDRFIMSNL